MQVIFIYMWCSHHLAGGGQQGTVPFPAQTLQLVTVLLQNCRHTFREVREGKD